jgi:hypothetical protein
MSTMILSGAAVHTVMNAAIDPLTAFLMVGGGAMVAFLLYAIVSPDVPVGDDSEQPTDTWS